MKKLFILIITVFLTLFVSCEAEKDYIVSENSNQNYQLKKISFSKFKSNQSAFQKLKEAHSKKKPNLKHKGIYNDDYGVFIDTTNIIVVENNGQQSITFQIIDETFSSKIENLVLNSKEDGGYTAYITEYLLSQQELQAIEKGEKIISKEPQTITKLENYARINITGNGAHCVDIITVTVKYCTGIDGKVIENTGDVGRNGCYGGFFEEDYQVLNISAGCLSNGNGSGNGNIGGYNPPTSGNNPIGGGASGGGGAMGGSPGSSNNPGTGTTNPQNPIITTPILNLDKIEIKLLNSFSTDQLNWWNDVADEEIKANILAYVKNYLNLEQEEAISFANEIAEQMRLNPELKLDIYASAKSPANIDMSSVQGTSEAEKKFRCIYEKLTQSPSFKNLFIDTFGTNNRINVKFEIVENLTFTNSDGSISYPNGVCQMSWINNNYANTIKISTNILEGQRSNIEIAKTILHECIHAYLNIKKINCNNGTTIPQINNKLFPELIGSFYQDNCFIDINGNNQGEHSFMFDYMVPVFQQVLGEVRDLIIPQNHIQIVEEGEYIDNLGSNLTWNWNDFYKYLSVNGLSNTQSFTDEVGSNPNKLYLFNFYNVKANQFSKTCN